ncbi:BA14K family protein [Bradyrhizobium australiense]|uniref:Lectin-like protein BA14k n=1 Tax=Bradyrhizobium australiense TaxID=2721161 RepID=A0A7Y4GVS2_9BRAD|nr:BA14K family protein [Bradyrhizobium australiense]NOJ42222.1 BA14K family protein [Bradyrhizobium australiense]
MKSWKIVSAAVALGISPLIPLQPAAASPMMAVAGAERLAASIQPVEAVQYRRWHRGPHYHRHGWHRRHHGTGAAVLGGLAAGAIIGGAIANSQARANDAVAYCAQRYRSYDPASGTYLGYDGNRHPCP